MRAFGRNRATRMTSPRLRGPARATLMVFGLAIPLTLGPTTPLHAGFQDGVVALRDGDHGSAHREFLALAEEGSRDAQLVLG